jgi:hypothetical protein
LRRPVNAPSIARGAGIYGARIEHSENIEPALREIGHDESALRSSGAVKCREVRMRDEMRAYA